MSRPAGRARPLRVVINARILPGGGAGGVEQHLLGLIDGLGRIDDGGTEYVIVTDPRAPDWLHGHLGPTQRVIRAPFGLPQWLGWVAGGVGRRAGRLGLPWPRVPLALRARRAATGHRRADAGFLESLGADVVHFAYQAVVPSALPSIYNPVDLQHVHHPRFFGERQWAKREASLALGCRQASAVAVASRETRRDVVSRYGVAGDRVYVIPWAVATDLYRTAPGDRDRVRRTYGLPEAFALYPAQAWPHKNHVRLLEALALLRDRDGLRVDLVCTGAPNANSPAVARRVGELELGDRVRFLGYVPGPDLQALYGLARLVVFPSLFESWGFPLFEAFAAGVPVAASSASALGEYGAGAVLAFDPTSVRAIAAAVGSLAREPALREDLVRRGRARLGEFSWGRTARTYCALYRRVGGVELSEEEQALLAAAGAPDEVPP